MIFKLKTKLLFNLLVFFVVCISGLWLVYALDSSATKLRHTSSLFSNKHKYVFFSTPWVYSKKFR